MAYDYAFLAVDEARVQAFVRYACLGEDALAGELAAAVAARFNVWGPATWFKQVAAGAWPHDDARFDHFLYLWGRPYFVLDREPEQVSATIARLYAEPGQARAAAIFLEQARRFRPDQAAPFEPLVSRDFRDETAEDRRPWVEQQQAELFPVHQAFAAQPPSLRLHGTAAGPSGQRLTPNDFAHLLAFRTAELCSLTGPFWVARNASLPDLVDVEDLAASPIFLFGRVEGFERRLLQLVPSQITERHGTGVYVRSKDLPELARRLYKPPQELLEQAPGKARLDLPTVRRVARMLREAVEHCRRNELGLWEAEGVCQPFEGDWP